jgi:hypothetical protein
MRMSARRIRSINATLARANGRSIYNIDRPLPPAVPDTTYSHIVAVGPSRS